MKSWTHWKTAKLPSRSPCNEPTRRLGRVRRTFLEDKPMSKENAGHFVDEANKYLQTARRGHRRSAVFNNAMIYHIICLSIEKYLLGLFAYHNTLPMHNTLTSMIREAAPLVQMPPFMIEEVTAMDNVVNLCDPGAPLEAIITDGQLQGMINTGEKLRKMVNEHLLNIAV